MNYERIYVILDSFTSDPSFCQTYLIGGIRGSGKTVLMTAVAKELEEKHKWICVDLNPSFTLKNMFILKFGTV